MLSFCRLRETLKALTQQVEKRDLHFNHQVYLLLILFSRLDLNFIILAYRRNLVVRKRRVLTFFLEFLLFIVSLQWIIKMCFYSVFFTRLVERFNTWLILPLLLEFILVKDEGARAAACRGKVEAAGGVGCARRIKVTSLQGADCTPTESWTRSEGSTSSLWW